MTPARPMIVAVASLAFGGSLSWAAEPTAVERGEKALLGRAYSPPTLPLSAYQDAWRKWDTKAKQPPERYAEAVIQHYGFAAAPYPNGGYPMGLRPGDTLLGKGLAIDCMLCHGGSIAGQSVVGLGNAALDLHAVFEDVGAAGPFVFSRARGTYELGNVFVSIMRIRNPDLTLRSQPLDLPLPGDLCEDVPPGGC